MPERLGRHPGVTVGLARVGTDRTFVRPREDVDELVLDQAVADLGPVGHGRERQDLRARLGDDQLSGPVTGTAALPTAAVPWPGDAPGLALLVGLVVLKRQVGSASFIARRGELKIAAVQRGDFAVNVRANGKLKSKQVYLLATRVADLSDTGQHAILGVLDDPPDQPAED